jgi:hypothetical protein
MIYNCLQHTVSHTQKIYLWAEKYISNSALRYIPQIYLWQQSSSVPGTATAVISLSHTVSTAGHSVFKHSTFPSGTETLTQNDLGLVPCYIFTVAISFVRFYAIWTTMSEIFHNLYSLNKHLFHNTSPSSSQSLSSSKIQIGKSFTHLKLSHYHRILGHTVA